jgi:hypothetical protein
VHALTCTYGATSLVDAAPRIGAWIARLAPRLTAVTIAFDADAPVRARRARLAAATAAALGCSVGFAVPRPYRGCLLRLDSDDNSDDDDDGDENDSISNVHDAGGDADDGSGSISISISSSSGNGGGGCVLRILAHLARCPNLRQLSLAPKFVDDTAEYVRGNRRVQALFCRLCDVAMHVEGRLLPRLCQQLSAACLTRLRLTITDGSYTADVFESVARLVQLRSLVLAGSFTSSVDALLQLRCLTQLRELDLHNVIMHSSDVDRPDDGDVDALVAPMPRLRILRLDLVPWLTWRALERVGRRCTQLAHLALNVDMLLEEPAFAGAPKPLFPLLQTLQVVGTSCSSGPSWCVFLERNFFASRLPRRLFRFWGRNFILFYFIIYFLTGGPFPQRGVLCDFVHPVVILLLQMPDIV